MNLLDLVVMQVTVRGQDQHVRLLNVMLASVWIHRLRMRWEDLHLLDLLTAPEAGKRLDPVVGQVSVEQESETCLF